MRLTTIAPLPAPTARNHRLLALMRLPYEYFVLYGGLLLFTGAFFTWSAIATLLHLALPRRFGMRVGRYAATAMFRAYVGVLKATRLFEFDLTALDVLRGQGALIIAPNHPSLIDAVLVGSRLPGVVCIMKAGIADNPILGGGARLAAYICDDSPLTMIRSASDVLRDGNQLLMFPEGTRTPPYSRLHFKGGYALIAKAAGVPVQTVIIETNTQFLGKGWPLLKKPVFPVVFKMRLGRRFEVNGDVKTAVAGMERYHREALGANSMRATAHQPDAKAQV